MQEQPPNNPEEDSRQRFKRLVDSKEEPSESLPPTSGGEEAEQTTSAEPENPISAEAPAEETPPTQFVSLVSQVMFTESEPETPEVHKPAEPEASAANVDKSASEHPEEQAELKRARIERTPPPPPPLGKTPPKAPPALGTQGMPLPKRVDEIDVDATRVTPSAIRFNQPTNRAKPPAEQAPNLGQTPPSGTVRRPVSQMPAQSRQAPPVQPPSPPVSRPITKPRQPNRWKQGLGCLLRMALIGIILMVILGLVGGSYVLYKYYQVAATLPSVDDLRQRSSQFETTRIVDRNGNTLYEIMDPNAGLRTYVTLNKISPYLVAATIATEDKGYYSHPGFDVLAILRAFLQNYRSGDTVSGASTITQQVARALFFTPAEQQQRTYERKVREALLAAEITRRYSKDEILELYLNEIYYGNMAYGVEAAAETYFGTSASKLTLGQAAFLAGLPQAPSVYDVYTNRDATITRLEEVLTLMMNASQAQNCIYVSNNSEPVCVDVNTAVKAYTEIRDYQFHSPSINMRYPHWVNYIRSLLEAQFDSQTIYRSGFTVYTTLDPALQDLAEQTVKEQISKLADKHVTDSALVAIRPKTGEILAMVGSADFNNKEISGEVNMAVSPRQPGSSIKPLTYLAAFEKGWNPATLIWDVPSEFPPSGDPNDQRPPYKPVNYDGRFHGPVTVRTALANSFNMPAVKTLQFVGIYGDPNNPSQGGLIRFAQRMGITTLTRNDYGLALTLGGGEVSLLEFTGAYGIIANGGLRMPPYAISKILDYQGNVVYQYKTPTPEPVLRPEHAYLMSSILSDNDARALEFGTNSVLNLPFTAAAKTGTTNDFRDNWTMGYTPDLVTGVWVGNADYTPMQNTTGVTGAAPIWANFMKTAVPLVTGGQPSPFVRPAGIIDRVICAVSGTEPSEWCPKQRGEIFAADQPPLPKEDDLWTKASVDTWTGLRASAACKDFTKDEQVLNVTDPWAVQWIQNDSAGKAWVKDLGFSDPITFIPSRECKADDPHPIVSFKSPNEGQTITTSPLDIFAQIDASGDFGHYHLEYGLGSDPVSWQQLATSSTPVKQPDKIYSWDLSKIPTGPVTLHIVLKSTHNTSVEVKLHLNIQVPTPTPTVTPTPTITLTPTVPPTVTPIPSSTPTVTSTPEPPGPTLPPLFTNTPAPTSGFQ